jgi:hypothetical protein
MAGTSESEKKANAEQGSAGQSREPSKGGRPTDYTKELGDAICAELAGGKSLKRICEKKEMPSRQTVYSWLRLPEFLDNYTRAKDDSADALADDIIDIAQGVLKKKYDPQAARVAIDGMKWSASKLKPKKYGDKLDLTGESTVTHKFKDLDDEQLDAAIAAVKNTVA